MFWVIVYLSAVTLNVTQQASLCVQTINERNNMTPGKVENVFYIVHRFMNLVSDYPYNQSPS